MSTFFSRGWAVFDPEPAVQKWAETARLAALSALDDPALAHWYQCEGTWFVGLDALNNDSAGRIAGSPPLSGAAVDFVAAHCGGWPQLHKAQISAVFAGYPRPRTGENEAGFRFRLKRDAAHVDGVIGKGAPKRRFIEEPHAFIFGIPLTKADARAAPLVVWEGSHKIMRATFQDALTRSGKEDWTKVDVTEVYQTARRQIFETCERKPLVAPPGSVLLLDRLVLHGVAPWQPNAQVVPEGRIIAYFRPPIPGGVRAWIGSAQD